ncbi:TetR/AcrR family transcriptional regulator [Ruegeria sp. HKCCA5491]|uniref:TetR/AcrR family transcriptional regulator n=1 Tax=Ruegeria sp. HKCCA5491 TaxID=2682986 RepID=UPI0014894430|nr:TetR/AcrR family transcriptional regulator [Ruegeria sp. HKCCA5491]
MENVDPIRARGRFGVSREQWLAAALDALEHGGVGAVRVKRLAETIGVNKSGFYFHFKDRQALLAALLEYWGSLEQGPVEVLDSNPLETPVEALKAIAETVDLKDLARHDASIRQWAKQDEAVAQVYEKKMQERLQLVRSLFQALGFEGLSCEVRARTFVGFTSAERDLFRDQSTSERAELRNARIELLISDL